MTILEDQDYQITYNQHLFLIHKVRRPDINSEAHVCVGEAFWRLDGYWEIRIAIQHPKSELIGQKLVAITDSPTIALEVLWEQRNNTFWGYLQ